MYLVCKYGPFKRSQSQQPAGAGDRPQQLPHRLQNQDKESRKQKEAADKELEHLNHKIDKILAKMDNDDSEEDVQCPADDLCAICLSAMATMQTLPCGHRVVCRKCFIKTIRSAIADRSLPLKCIVCRASVLKLGPTPTQRRRPAAAAAAADAFSSVTSSSSSTPLRSICRRRTASYTAAQTLSLTPTKTENPAHRRVQPQQLQQLEYVATVDDVDRLDHHWRRYEEQIPTSNLNGLVADRGDTYRTARSLVRNSAATDHNGNSYSRSVSTSAATAAGVGRINERAVDWFAAGNRDSSTSSRGCGSCHHHRHRLRPQTASANAPPASTPRFALSQQQQHQQHQQSRVTTTDASSADFSLQTGATLLSAGSHAAAFHAGAGTPSAGTKLTLQPMPIYPAQGSAPTQRRAFFASSWSASSSSTAEADGDGAAADRSKGPSSTTDGNGRRQQVALQSAG